MSDDVTLLPCPFCGKEPMLHRLANMSSLHKVSCKFCDAGPHSSLSREAAITAWNTRTPSPDSGERMREALRTATGLASGPNGAGRMKVVVDGLEPGEEHKLHYLLSAALQESAR